MTRDTISIRGARLHNLKNIDLDIPKNKLVVLTGISGSGKSTLAFDILHKEGIRQYMEALGMLAFGMSKPPVDAIHGLSPTISIEQRHSNTSPRSTVGTSTDVYTFLRVLFARLGRRKCSGCGYMVPPTGDLGGSDWQGEAGSDESSELDAPKRMFPCPNCGTAVIELSMAHFSFNKPAGACPTCTGLGSLMQVNLERMVNADLSLRAGAITTWDDWHITYHSQNLQETGKHYGFAFDPDKPLRDYSEMEKDLLFYGVESPHFTRHFPGVEPPAAVSKGRFEGAATNLLRRYAEHIHEPAYRAKLAEYMLIQPCPDCQGTRLRPESRAVTVAGRSIIDLAQMPLDDLAKWMGELPGQLDSQEFPLAQAVLDDLHARLERLLLVGAGYLSLDRVVPSLSTGEVQRLRLAALVGSSLSGVLYIFDEPTIGLHQRDTRRLLQVLRRLVDLGNTVLVVEHDLEVARAADVLVDIGPGAGKYGGQIVAVGTADEVAQCESSITGAFLSGKLRVAKNFDMRGDAEITGFDGAGRRQPGGRSLTINEACQHNLQHITVNFPVGLFTVISGVSGSGKSSLVFDILEKAGRQHFFKANEAVGAHGSIQGWEHFNTLVSIGQEPIGRVSRSNAATYADVFTPLRELYARQPEARKRGFSARQFSFNVPGGRCERCEGSGMLAISMHFLPDVLVRCPACQGRRFTAETLAVQYAGVDISQVLELTAVEALEVFPHIPAVANRLQLMCDVGLGYLQLGQPADTLSGGEAQRVKLAKELGRHRVWLKGGRADSGRSKIKSGKGKLRNTLYLLDEPTIGLHPHDVVRLLGVLERLVEAGNTVVVVEHNLDVIRCADWVIDLGPDGGAGGGRIVAQGTPEQVAGVDGSYIGRFLREVMRVG